MYNSVIIYVFHFINMPGSYLQLVAQGKEDQHIYGSINNSYFTKVFRKQTNFAIETIPIQFNTGTDFGEKITVVLPRKGDLIRSCILRVEIPALNDPLYSGISYVNSIGHALIEDVEILIGDTIIDKFNGEWLEIWSSYYIPEDKRAVYADMVGKYPMYSLPPYLKDQDTFFTKGSRGYLYIPLPFWFTRDIGMTLPMVALQMHEVRINIKLRRFRDLIFNIDLEDPTPACLADVPILHIDDAELLCDYVFLAEDERVAVANAQHEFIIDDVQMFNKVGVACNETPVNIKLPFNRPVRAIYWTIQRVSAVVYGDYFNYNCKLISEPGSRLPILETATIQLEGHDKYEKLMHETYFRQVVPFMAYTATPVDNFIYSISFAIAPGKTRPSGSLNATKINDLTLKLNFYNVAIGSTSPIIPSTKNYYVNVYAQSYNVLRIFKGIGGLLYFR
jgi:hypothetical protein